MTYETSVERAGRALLAVVMMTMGVLHFTNADTFASIVPDYLPAPLALVYLSGVAEFALGAMLWVERTRRFAAYGLVLLFVAVFPAIVHWALHPELEVAGLPSWLSPSATALWLRLPLQLVLIVWALRCARPGLTH